MTGKAPLKRILVANRGEIACRIFKTAIANGYETVAVYSEADAACPHVEMADQAICIGPAPVGESYLNIDNILAAAKEADADAIHPGYGFLSENADFARACATAGLYFLGPSASAIELMGNKATAKRHMLAAGVPCVPGYQGEDQTDASLSAAASDIGYPLMVKAAAGGGGRGMRLVEQPADFLGAVTIARSEAESAFGSGELILEKAIIAPRHVEVQVFGDNVVYVVHMGERDCSVQRRHQKVIEEAPCPVMTDKLRFSMGAAAVEAAKSINYVGAGTVEFLLDASGAFYFLEMNTRLQVEHPVTEMVTGLDLVALQIKVAQGEPIGLEQSDISFNGHAIEVRLYAEDPSQGFLPVTGTITKWQAPEGARTDAGIIEGQEISPFYDPMLAKIIVHGETREQARLRLLKALKETVLLGTKTNLGFLIDCLKSERFAQAQATTSFISENFGPNALAEKIPTAENLAAASVIEFCLRADEAFANSLGVSDKLKNWASASGLSTPAAYCVGTEEFDLLVKPASRNEYEVLMGQQSCSVEVSSIKGGKALLVVGGRKTRIYFHWDRVAQLNIAIDGQVYSLRNQIYSVAGVQEGAVGGTVTAPMHGLVQRVNGKVGMRVEAGDCLAVLEAMKMQHQINASIGGTLESVLVSVDEQVASDQIMFEIKEDEEPA